MSPILELEHAAERLLPVDELRRFTDLVYSLDVSEFTDEDFEVAERVIDRAIRLIADSANEERRTLIARLLVAREGIEQGIAPDPANRPSLEQMRQFVADHL